MSEVLKKAAEKARNVVRGAVKELSDTVTAKGHAIPNYKNPDRAHHNVTLGPGDGSPRYRG